MDQRGGVSAIWWPALLAGMALVAGLAVLAATPGAAPGDVRIYEDWERPSPIPTDPAADRLIDLNRASRAELEALPGIGEARAEAIIAAREEAPFTSLAEVEERGVLPARVLAGLAGWATARDPAHYLGEDRAR